MSQQQLLRAQSLLRTRPRLFIRRRTTSHRTEPATPQDRAVQTQRCRLAQLIQGHNDPGSEELATEGHLVTDPVKTYLAFLEKQLLTEDGGLQTRMAPLLELLGLDGGSLENLLRVAADVAALSSRDNNPSRSVHSILMLLLAWHAIQTSSWSDESWEIALKAILAIICSLTAVVQPGLDDDEEGSYHLLERHVANSAKRPFTVFLHSCNCVLPDPFRENNPKLQAAKQPAALQIYASRVNWSVLRDIGKCRIKWTASLSSHMVFVKSSRTLYLFAFPSLCAVSLDTKLEDGTPLSLSLLRQYYSDTQEPRYGDEKMFDQFLREVLLSYRLVLGQSRMSRRLFHSTEKKAAAISHRSGLIDPLLATLCGQKNSKRIRSLSPSLWPSACRDVNGNLLEQGVYDSEMDFAILGPRLLALQTFITRQQPSRIRDLWRDRRDPLQWYTFWLVLILGGISLIVSTVQCALSAVQVHYQLQPAGK